MPPLPVTFWLNMAMIIQWPCLCYVILPPKNKIQTLRTIDTNIINSFCIYPFFIERERYILRANILRNHKSRGTTIYISSFREIHQKTSDFFARGTFTAVFSEEK
jgi:hypothetical protein